MNSIKLILPSLSLSVCSKIESISSPLICSRRAVVASLTSTAVMYPSPSWSNSLKVWLSSSLRDMIAGPPDARVHLWGSMKAHKPAISLALGAPPGIGRGRRVQGHDDAMVAPLRGGLVVVLGDQPGDRGGELLGEGGPVGGAREADVGVDRVRGEALIGLGGAGDEGADLTYQPCGDGQQPAGGQLVGGAGGVGLDGGERGGGEDARGGPGPPESVWGRSHLGGLE